MAVPGPVPIIADARSAAALLPDLARSRVEQAVVLYLDPNRRFLGDIRITGSTAAVAPSFRAVIAGALRLDAAALVLAHNHPNGDATPSPADLAYTRDLIRIAAALDIVIIDHLILAGPTVTSLRDLGLM
jgi:DNA repair protein RadC